MHKCHFVHESKATFCCTEHSKSVEETEVRNKEQDSKNGRRRNVSPPGNTLNDQSEADFSKGHMSWQSAQGLVFKG